MADITMPQLGETVTEGTITKWFKEVGEEIKEDEVLFEVSTDKVDSEVPSPTSGYLAEILVPEGDTVDVGTKLAVITDSPPDGGGGGGGGGAEAEEPAEPEAGADDEGDDDAQADTDEALAADDVSTEEDREPAKAEAKAPSAGKGDGKGDGDGAQGAAPAEETAASSDKGGDGGGGRPAGGGSKLLSPVVRRLIAEHDLDPDRIEGTGAGGRITRNDVLAVIEGGDGAAAPPEPERETAPAPAAKSAPAAKDGAPAARPSPRPAPLPAAKAGERDEVVPFTNIRRRTAEHMVRSKATSAHTLIAVEVDYVKVDAVRSRVKDSFKDEEGTSLTYLPFISRAVIDAIREFPYVNASVGDDELIVHRDINLGIAVDLDFEGLVAPVVHDADGKRMRALAREIADLARRARSRKLGPDDISGGTFTITNAGPFGTFITAPIINQPQVAILGTDGVKKRPVVVEGADGSDAIAIHPVGVLALTFDHRAFDGAYAAAFVARVREILETRDWEAEL